MAYAAEKSAAIRKAIGNLQDRSCILAVVIGTIVSSMILGDYAHGLCSTVMPENPERRYDAITTTVATATNTYDDLNEI